MIGTIRAAALALLISMPMALAGCNVIDALTGRAPVIENTSVLKDASVEQLAFATASYYGALQAEALEVVSDPTVEEKVKDAIKKADAIGAPSMQLLITAANEYGAARFQYEQATANGLTAPIAIISTLAARAGDLSKAMTTAEINLASLKTALGLK